MAKEWRKATGVGLAGAADLFSAGFLRKPERYEDSRDRRVFADEGKHGVVAFNSLAPRP